MKSSRIKISFYLNIVIFLLVLMATIFMITGFHFMSDDIVLDATKLSAFKFFTVDSNIFMGIMALIFAIYEYQIIDKKSKKIPEKIYVLKLVSTTSVMLTFLVTVLYLAPYAKTGFFSMFQNSNLFFHLIIPVLSLITFIFFENKNLKFKYTFYGLIPTFFYAIFYVINILTHLENGKISFKYDWYGFAQGGINTIGIIFTLMHIITYVITLIIWFLNRKLGYDGISKI